MQHLIHEDSNTTYRTRRSGGWFSPGRIIVLLTGIVLTMMGIAAIFNAGVDSDLTTPLVDVMTVQHSAAIGILEIIAGLFMVLGAASEYTRGTAAGIGLVAVVAGVIGMASSLELQRQIGFDGSTARFFVLWGTVALVGGLLPALYTERIDVEAVGPTGDSEIVERERSRYVA